MTVGLMIMIRMQDDLFLRQLPSTIPISCTASPVSTAKQTCEHWKMASTPLPLYADLKQESDHIARCSKYLSDFQRAHQSRWKRIQSQWRLHNTFFLYCFGFALETGNTGTALLSPNTVVLSKTTAEKFFGQVSPVGKIITMENGQALTVTGLLKEPQGKSHIDFEAYVSFSSLSAEKQIALSHWFEFDAPIPMYC